MGIPGINTLRAYEFMATLDGEPIDTIESFAYDSPGAGSPDHPITLVKPVETSAQTAFNRWLIATSRRPIAPVARSS